MLDILLGFQLFIINLDYRVDISLYYEEICSKQPLLSREEESALFGVIGDTTGLYTDKEKKKAKDRIISANLRFVFQKAKARSRRAGSSDVFEELISAGNEGLLKAFDKYSPEFGVRFLTYAGWWVLQTQLKELSNLRVVALPIYKQQLAALIAKEQDRLGRPPTDDDLTKAFPDQQLPVLKELRDSKYLTYYLDDMLENDPSFEDHHASYEYIHEDDLHTLCKQLPPPYSTVVDKLFGLTDGKEMTLVQISQLLGVTRDDINKYRKEAFRRLRKKFLSPVAFTTRIG
jgi:RNA polymerase sigma factor (sigma-70 family)